MITEGFEVCNIFILHVSKNNNLFYYHCFEYVLTYYMYQELKIINRNKINYWSFFTINIIILHFNFKNILYIKNIQN